MTRRPGGLLAGLHLCLPRPLLLFLTVTVTGTGVGGIVLSVAPAYLPSVASTRTTKSLIVLNCMSLFVIQAFAAAQRLAGQPDPTRCYLVDDSWSNIRAAAAASWHPILVGHSARDGRSAEELPEKEHVIGCMTELEATLPQLFIQGDRAQL